MSIPVRKRALLIPKDDLSSITLDDEGNIFCHKIGVSKEYSDPKDEYVVLYQKGLVPKEAARSYKWHISNF